MSEKIRLIIVDDEAAIRGKVSEYMAGQGYAVATASTGSEMDGILRENSCDLVVLDMGLPGENSLEIVRRLSSAAHIPIIMLADQGNTADCVAGLELGADDYLTKPFDCRELLARVRSVLRRTEPLPPAAPMITLSRKIGQVGQTGPAAANDENLISLGSVRLDMARCRVIDPDGNETKLTTMERDLLDVFARHPNRVLTRQQLLDLAHCREEEPFDRSIDIRVTRIRRKIEPNPARPQMIRTVRGSGYMFVPPAFGGNGATTVEFRRRPDLEAASFTRRWAPALESLSA